MSNVDWRRRLEVLRRKKRPGYRWAPERRPWAIWRAVRDENAALAAFRTSGAMCASWGDAIGGGE